MRCNNCGSSDIYIDDEPDWQYWLAMLVVGKGKVSIPRSELMALPRIQSVAIEYVPDKDEYVITVTTNQ